MRAKYFERHVIIQGRLDEESRINNWIKEAKNDDKYIEVVVDDSDEHEISYTVVSKYVTQKELRETFREAKRKV